MSRIVEDPPIEAARSHFSQLCVLLTGIASGIVEPTASEALESPNFLMGRRDGYHVVVAHLASSRTLKEASDKCVAFGRGVVERASTHPYGTDWCHGFSQAVMSASSDLAMYAATCTLPQVDRQRLRLARTAARHLSPFGASWNTANKTQPIESQDSPSSPREW